MTLKRVSPGDPLQISAQAFNTFIDMANARQGGFGAITTDQLNGVSLNTTVFPVKNGGGDLDRFSILSIGGPIFTPTDNADEFKSNIAFTGSTPGATPALGRFCVLLEPCKAGSIAKAAFFGVTVAKVDVLDSSHGWADVKPSSSESLRSGQFGSAQILYKESGTGVKLALIRIGFGERQFYPAVVTGSSPAYGKDYQWSYTVQMAESTVPGLDNWAAKEGASSLTAYNLFEKIDRATVGSYEPDPNGDGTDDGTIQPIEDDSLVMICWLPTADGTSGAWYFERSNSILAACSGGA